MLSIDYGAGCSQFTVAPFASTQKARATGSTREAARTCFDTVVAIRKLRPKMQKSRKYNLLIVG